MTTEDPWASRRSQEDPLRGAAGGMWIICVLAALGALVGGIVLMMQTACDASAFSSCLDQSHPFMAAGISVLVGGLLWAAVVGVVAHLCNAVADVREQAARAAAPAEG
jgi:ABC-type Fe3+ transport system permease subunit